MGSPMSIPGICAICYEPLDGFCAEDENGDHWDVHPGICAIDTGIAEPDLCPSLDLGVFAVKLPQSMRSRLGLLRKDLAGSGLDRALRVVEVLDLLVTAQTRVTEELLERAANQ